jgi:hypothetical protein
MPTENKKKMKISLETIMEKIQCASYDDWVKNFALNLINIWNESSAAELTPTNGKTKLKSAIVIGRGPSVKKKGHLEMLAKSNFNGAIVCCDGALINTLKAGVTPEKFSNFYVVSIDPYSPAMKFYDDKIVDRYGDKIKGIFSTIVKPTTVENARKSGIKIHWLHSLFDYEEGKKSFNQISASMVRAKNHHNGLPAIQTGGNVGTSSWFIAWRILKCPTVALIGINHGWNEDDPWEKIISHGSDFVKTDVVDRKSDTFEKLFKKVYNPDFNCNCIVDPLFQFYSSALKEFIVRSPEWLTTINATEGGSIFGDKIIGMPFDSFLGKYH